MKCFKYAFSSSPQLLLCSILSLSEWLAEPGKDMVVRKNCENVQLNISASNKTGEEESRQTNRAVALVMDKAPAEVMDAQSEEGIKTSYK